jgi:small-conductance mechanosensitive channel
VDANELGSLLCLLSFFVNFHFSLFQLLDSTGLDLVCFYLIVVVLLLLFFVFVSPFPSATYTRKSKGFLGKKRQLAIIILSVAVPLFLVSLIAYMWLKKKRKTKGNKIACVVLFTHICVLLSQEKNVLFIRNHLD